AGTVTGDVPSPEPLATLRAAPPWATAAADWSPARRARERLLRLQCRCPRLPSSCVGSHRWPIPGGRGLLVAGDTGTAASATCEIVGPGASWRLTVTAMDSTAEPGAMSEVLMLGQPVARRGHKGHGPGSGAGRLSRCRTGLQNSSGSYDVMLMRRAA